jgi:hypothetical protein
MYMKVADIITDNTCLKAYQLPTNLETVYSKLYQQVSIYWSFTLKHKCVMESTAVC